MSASNGQESQLSGTYTFAYAAGACIRANCSTSSTSQETRALTANLTLKNFEQKIYLAWSYLGNESAEGIRNYFIRLASSATRYRQIFSYGGFTSSSNGHHVESTNTLVICCIATYSWSCLMLLLLIIIINVAFEDCLSCAIVSSTENIVVFLSDWDEIHRC